MASKEAPALDGRWPLPAGWKWVRLSEIAEVVGGGTPSNAADADNFDPDGTPWITPADLSGYTSAYIARGARSLSEKGFKTSSARIMPKGTVLLSSRAPVGYVAIAANPICTNQGFKSLVLSADVLPEFARYYLLFSREYLQANASGTTFKELAGRTVRTLWFPLAPLDEQHRIVERIEELFGEIEAGQQELAAAKTDLGRYRRAVLKAAVTGELTDDWRKRNPPKETGADLLTRILKERRARWEEVERAKFAAKGQVPKNDTWKSRYPEPVAPDTDDLPELPESWAWSSLDQLTFKMTSGSRAWSPYYDRGSSIFIMAQNVRPARFDLSFKQFVDPPENDPERERTRVAKDDVLITIVGANTGDVCRLTEQLDDAYVCQSVALLRPVDREWSGYIEAYLVAEEGGQAQFAKQIYGAGRPHLSFDQLRSVAIPIPPEGERGEIVTLVREAIDVVAEFAAQIDGQAEDVTRLRQSILLAAFSGELVAEVETISTKKRRHYVA